MMCMSSVAGRMVYTIINVANDVVISILAFFVITPASIASVVLPENRLGITSCEAQSGGGDLCL